MPMHGRFRFSILLSILAAGWDVVDEYIYIYIFIYLFICIYTTIYIYTYAHTHTYIYIYTYFGTYGWGVCCFYSLAMVATSFRAFRHNKLIWLAWYQRGYCSKEDIAQWHFDGNLPFATECMGGCSRMKE